MIKKQTFLLFAALLTLSAPAFANPQWGENANWRDKFGWNEALANPVTGGPFSNAAAVNTINSTTNNGVGGHNPHNPPPPPPPPPPQNPPPGGS